MSKDFDIYFLKRKILQLPLLVILTLVFMGSTFDISAKSSSKLDTDFATFKWGVNNSLVIFQQPGSGATTGGAATGGATTGGATTTEEICDGKDNDGDGLIDEGTLDSDLDGTPDCKDFCPLDASKIRPGLCGCGRIEDRWDTDNDGVIDCLDACPMNPAKQYDAGLCGCNFDPAYDYIDSDQDGIIDCLDKCPSNPFQAGSTQCGCEAPTILDVAVNNISACDPHTNTYTADITVYFAYPPELGGLTFRGDANFYHNFENYNTKTQLTFPSISFRPHGGIIDLIVEYKGNEGCNFHLYNGPSGPPPCSVTPPSPTIVEDIITNPISIDHITPSCGIDYISISNMGRCSDNRTRFKTADDFFTADITIKYSNPPTGGMLKLTGASNIWIAADKLVGQSEYTVTGFRLPADGNDFQIGAVYTHGLSLIHISEPTRPY